MKEMKLIKIIFSIILPPVAAYMQVGITTHFWINLALTVAGGLPGIIHAIWLIVTDKKR